MYRQEGLEILTGHRGDALAVLGVGYVGRELYKLDHRDTTLYNIEMPYPTALALGLALALPSVKVLAIDGDGSLLSGVGVLTTVANEAPSNFIIIVFDNEAYVSTGGIASPSSRKADIAAMARGAGLERATTTHSPAEFDVAVRDAMESAGPSLVVAKVNPHTKETLVPLPFNLTEGAIRFRRALVDAGLVDRWGAGVSWSMSFDHEIDTSNDGPQ
jgi:sulfopyruvate decarboxylase subunit beta